MSAHPQRKLAVVFQLVAILPLFFFTGDTRKLKLLSIPAAPLYSGCGGEIPPEINDSYEQQVVELVNETRTEQGLPPLKRMINLDSAARYHATDLAQDNYFDHDTYDRADGSLVEVCSWSERISGYYVNWSSLAENIAAGYGDPQSVMSGWMASEGHRANILSQNNREIGVGYYEGGGSYFRYWVQDFGRRSNVYPLIINGDSADTVSRTVSIYIYGDWQDMRLKNDDGEWSDWLPFVNEFTWELGSSSGIHTVWAEMQSGTSSFSSSDSILLTLEDSEAVLGNLPDAIFFTYSISEGKALLPVQSIVPMNTGNTDPLNWAVSSVGDWYNVIPLNGWSPDPITMTLSNFPEVAGLILTGTLTLTVTSPQNTLHSPHAIVLTLTIVDYDFTETYLPLVMR